MKSQAHELQKNQSTMCQATINNFEKLQHQSGCSDLPLFLFHFEILFEKTFEIYVKNDLQKKEQTLQRKRTAMKMKRTKFIKRQFEILMLWKI